VVALVAIVAAVLAAIYRLEAPVYSLEKENAA